mmetsp:Transcript_43396/g.68720  ORF Transcript_43396/g.68720 Transcript_43396/m.68720 type:complete len:237 (-) Transcript_43396:26-736(-)
MGCSISSSNLRQIEFVEHQRRGADNLNGVRRFRFGKNQDQLEKRRPEIFEVVVSKDEGTPLGAAVKYINHELVVLSISGDGALTDWNDKNPGRAILPGDKILSVNGVVDDDFQMISELWKVGLITLEVTCSAYKELQLERTSNRVYLAQFALCSHVPLQCPVDSLPHANASDCGATECIICLEEYEPDTRVVRLPCKHAFHPVCAARWFCQGKRRCPLCNRCVHNVPTVGVQAVGL